jgi:hypothetical protein
MGVDASGRLVRVGSLEEVLSDAEEHATHVGLDGRFVVPGMIDAHVHLFLGGLALNRLDLTSVGKTLSLW